jgi:UPF0042 nucleotide-binding protein
MKKTENDSQNLPDVVIITGLSGSGMTSATNAFEDLGYFCVDNLPVTLLPTFAQLLTNKDLHVTPIERAALVINIREGHFLSDFPQQLKFLKEQGLDVFVLFLEATDKVLQRRFSETRRPHPADKGNGLKDAIERERQELNVARRNADLIIDTSEHTVHTLRSYLIKKFSPEEAGVDLNVQIFSFGHKYGTPHEVDMMFDVRHLPNPYFEPELRHLSGGDRRIINYLNQQPEVKETIKRFGDLLIYLLPQYKREGKSYFTVGIGCTGGRHRSVMITNTLAKMLQKEGYKVQKHHRDIKKNLKK